MSDYVGVMTYAKDIKPGMTVIIEQFAEDSKVVKRVEKYNDGLICLIFDDDYGVYLGRSQPVVRLEFV